ncbi:hypothetical protein BH23CHL6_BH23CHL6_04400 [soil metagenome]
MAEQGGISFGEGPTACPFIALESDRDRRADEPDHRHRCYAEPEPAPRAIAHQRGFCLAPTFPGCPIFQDWAVRAGARPVPKHPNAAVRPPETSMSAPDWDGRPPWVADAAPDEPQQLGAFDGPPQGAPPPAGGPPADPVERSTAPTVPIPQHAPPDEGVAPRVDPGMPTLPIERVPSLPVDRTGDAERDARLEAQRQQRMLEERERRAEEERRRRGEEERRERERRAEAAAVMPPFLTDRTDAPPPPSAGPPPSPAGPPPSAPPERTVPRAPQAPQAPQQRPTRRSSKEEWAAKREDLVPVWERQPIRAYPTMRRRIGIGGSGDAISTLTTLLAVLAVIALVVFAVIALPSLLGGTTPGRTTVPGAASPAGTVVAATPVPTPTAVPQPTPRTYTIQAGDSLFAVALQFGLTVDQLLAANPDIEDANYVTIGQVIVIPDAASPAPVSPRATGSPPP